jgi:hypothetical protein
VPFDSESENEPPNLLGGHPKGSTISSSLELKKRIRDAMDDAVRELKKVHGLKAYENICWKIISQSMREA